MADGDADDIDEDDPDWIDLPPMPLVTWQDLADFTADVDDDDQRARLESAIHGKGAFPRFRSIVFDHDIGHQWRERSTALSTERLSTERLRAELFELGVRCG